MMNLKLLLFVAGLGLATQLSAFPAGTLLSRGDTTADILTIDTSGTPFLWNQAWIGLRDVLAPGKSYSVTLEYRVLERTQNESGMLFIVRPVAAGNEKSDLVNVMVFESEWTPLQLEFETPAAIQDYSLQIHSRYGLKAQIRNLRCREIPAPFVTRTLRENQSGEVPQNLNYPIGAAEFEVERPTAERKIHLKGEDFGFSTTADDNSAAWRRAMEACRNTRQAQLDLAPGTYRFSAPEKLLMDGLEDFILDGNGATLIFAKPPASEEWLRVVNCRKILLRNFTLDWDWELAPIASIAKVVDIASDRGSLDLEFIQWKKFPAPEARIADMQQLDPQTFSVGGEDYTAALFEFIRGRYPEAKRQWLNDNTMRLWPNDISQSRIFEKAQKGDLYRIRHYTYDMNALVLLDNQHLTLSNVQIFSSTGHGVLMEGEQRYLEFDRLKVMPKPGSGRCISTAADHIHSGQSQGFIKILNSEFSHGGDDCLNFNDMSGMGRIVDERTIASSNVSVDIFHPGDEVELRYDNFAPTNVRVKIAQVLPGAKNNGIDMLVLSEPLPESLPREDKYLLFNWRFDTRNLLIRNSFFHDNRARGALILARDVTIENNRFSHNQSGALQIETGYESGFWSEGYGASNIVVRNNIFDYVNPDGAAANGWVRDIHVASYTTPKSQKPPYRLICDVWFDGNTFIDSVGALLYVTNAERILFTGNQIQNTRHRRRELPYRGAVILDNVKDVWIFHNQYQPFDDLRFGVVCSRSRAENVLFTANQ